MLVTCPECGAQYEVEAALIPSGGRRVQCSACDHAWTEIPAAAETAEIRSAALAAEVAEEAATAPPPLAAEVKAILREEAEREARIRRERGLVEIRPEAAAGPAAAAARKAPVAGSATGPAVAAREAPLPEPEAIAATLRPSSLRDAVMEERGRARGGGGFTAGLVLGLCLVALAVLAYLGAPRIAEKVPVAAPALDAYVAGIETARATLDRAVARAAAAVTGLAGG